VVSLTPTPSLCAKFLQPVHEQKHGRLYRASEKVFDGILSGYRGSLGWVLDHPLLMLGVTLGTACLSVYLYVVVPKGFFPQQDTGRLTGNVRVPPDVSFAVSSEKLQDFARIVQADPAVENVGASGGFGGGGNLNIQLWPLEQRKISADRVTARLRPTLARVAGAQLFLQSPQDISIGG